MPTVRSVEPRTFQVDSGWYDEYGLHAARNARKPIAGLARVQGARPHMATSVIRKRPESTLLRWLHSIHTHIASWTDTCSRYYQAAVLYEHLSRLSDAELARRGLSRASLAHDLIQAVN